jgi:hypothetical protein
LILTCKIAGNFGEGMSAGIEDVCNYGWCFDGIATVEEVA